MRSATIPGFGGTVIRPDEAGYDGARAIWNAMHDRRSALIARPRSAQDVAAAIRYARAEGLLIAVRGGGHSIPGHSVCDDGIVIDLRALNQVRVDPRKRRAAGRCSARSTAPPSSTAWCFRPASSATPARAASRSAAASAA